MKLSRLAVFGVLAAAVLSLAGLTAAQQGSSKRNLNVRVDECPAPSLALKGPDTAIAGDNIILSWDAVNVSGLKLDGVGEVAGDSIQVKVAGKGMVTYILRGTAACGAEVVASKDVRLSSGKVFLNGSLYVTGLPIASLLQAELQYTEQALASGEFAYTAEGLAEYRGYEKAVQSWPPSAEVFRQAHVGGLTDIIDEDGHVLGQLNSWGIVAGSGVPGLSYMGQPFKGTGVGLWGSNAYGYGELTNTFNGGVTLTVSGLTYDVVGWMMVSPIVLDLDNDGKPDVDQGRWLPHPKRFNKSGALAFDINGDGFAEVTEWIGPNDGLLVAPLEGGKVKGGNELFGNPIGFVEGYQKLGLHYDKDQNGAVEGKELEGLMVWVDKDHNGKVEPGELRPVQEYGITSISTQQENLKSSFVINGRTRSTWDWWPTCMVVYPSMLAKAGTK